MNRLDEEIKKVLNESEQDRRILKELNILADSFKRDNYDPEIVDNTIKVVIDNVKFKIKISRETDSVDSFIITDFYVWDDQLQDYVYLPEHRLGDDPYSPVPIDVNIWPVKREINQILNTKKSKNETYKYPTYDLGITGIRKVEFSTRGGRQVFESVMTKWDDDGPTECEIVYNYENVIARITYDENYNDSDLEIAVKDIEVLDEYIWYMFIELMMSRSMN